MSNSGASNPTRFFSPALLIDDRACKPASNAVLSVAATVGIVPASTAAIASVAVVAMTLRAWRQRFSAATRDVVAAPATFTTTLARSMSLGMSESGQRRDALSCAALRKIGRRKFPLEASIIASSPEGVVDVAAVRFFCGYLDVGEMGGGERGKGRTYGETLHDFAPLFECVEVVQGKVVSET
jgi:hypothetical protein